MKPDERAQKIERAIRLTFDSLQSHLGYTYDESAEGRSFHIKCVKEYSELISLLTELYVVHRVRKKDAVSIQQVGESGDMLTKL